MKATGWDNILKRERGHPIAMLHVWWGIWNLPRSCCRLRVGFHEPVVKNELLASRKLLNVLVRSSAPIRLHCQFSNLHLAQTKLLLAASKLVSNCLELWDGADISLCLACRLFAASSAYRPTCQTKNMDQYNATSRSTQAIQALNKMKQENKATRIQAYHHLRLLQGRRALCCSSQKLQSHRWSATKRDDVLQADFLAVSATVAWAS